jgi:two-component system cell cycle response regulator
VIGEEYYKKIFHITERFYSSLDKEVVIKEILFAFQELFPNFSCFLLLSQDHKSHGELPIMNLDYNSKNVSAMNAYVTGIVQMDYLPLEMRSILYAPLKGNQGVYGVLQVDAQKTLDFLPDDVELITILTRSAGNAMENAQLYQQSRQVISDLQLINEASQQLNSNLRLAEIMGYLSKQIQYSFDAQEVGFFFLTDKQEFPKVLPGSTEFFDSKQARIYIDYIGEKIIKGNEPLYFGDLNIQKISNGAIFRSLLAIPMIQTDSLKGFSIILHQSPNFFSFDTYKLLQALIYHSSLALTNSMLREELERMIITDHLTKLHSRKFLDEKIQKSMNEDDEGTFILIDIDNFKGINDTFGHQTGDELLIQVANLIKVNIRENDVGARWGGEELAIYLPKVCLEEGKTIAERLVDRVAECSKPSITISCGVSYWHREQFDSYPSLFKRADEALYVAKGTGKNKAITQRDIIKAS